MTRKYISRQIENIIAEAADHFPVTVVTGPRQTGKSTLIKHCFPHHQYVTLDNPLIRKTCKEDPALFLENYPPPTIIDEIQYAPELLPYIKIAVDEDRSKTGQFLLTGSQIFPLMKGLSESLAGRVAIFELQGFSLEEYNEKEQDIVSLFSRIFLGSFPDPLVHNVNRNIFYSSYLQTYPERDIRQVENVQDLSIFHNLLELLAARTGSLLNQSSLSKELGISQTTVNRWISLLESSRIIYLLRPYTKNINKRVIKSPKIYFFDTGLISFLLKYPDSKTLSMGPLNGSIFKNFVISELLKKRMNRNILSELYFYRDSNGNEIDLVIDQGFKKILCEIKISKAIKPRHYNQLLNQKDLFENPSLFLISAQNGTLNLTRDVINIPAWKAASLIGG